MKYQARTYAIEIRGARAVAREIYLRELPPTPIAFPITDKDDPLFGLMGPSFLRGSVACVFEGAPAVEDTDEDRAAFQAEVFAALDKISAAIWHRIRVEAPTYFRPEVLDDPIAKATEAMAAAPTVGRCGHTLTLTRDPARAESLRCTKVPHHITERHAVTSEDGTEIVNWSHLSVGFLLRGVIE